MKSKNDFQFNYVAPTNQERKEIESIRNSYMPKNKASSKFEYLKKLDSKVNNTPTIISLVFGIVGILIFGLGFAMVLEWNLLVWGIVVSVIGVVPTLLAYPVYLKTLEYLKNKYSEEILKISEELLDEKTN